MNILVLKYFRYQSLVADPRFSFEIAFRRLKGVLEVIRKTIPGSQIRIVVPNNEIYDAKKYIELYSNEYMHTLNSLLLENTFFSNNSQILVFDEQSFYVSEDLVNSVVKESKGQACGWEDPEKLLWSFNYDHACHFFIAPGRLIKKYLRLHDNFLGLKDSILKENRITHKYSITSKDIPAIYERALKFNPYPYHYYIEPTSRCNSKCIMCPFHSTDPEIMKGRVYVGDDGDDMPCETFKRLIDEIVSIGWNYLPDYRKVQITPQARGEATLAPDFRKMLLYAKDEGFKVSFTTNGSTLHNDDLAEFLVDIGIDEIIVSIDGDEQEYSKIRPQLNYKQVVSNLEYLRKLRDKKASGLPALFTKRVHLRVTPEEADRKYIKKFTPIVDWVGIGFENYDDFKIEGKGYTEYFFDVSDSKRLPCLWATDVSFIKADGNVEMCFGAAKHYIGNINEKPLLDILKESELRNSILNNHSIGKFDAPIFCSHCTSWKHNYHIIYEEEEYLVRKNPTLSYWKKK